MLAFVTAWMALTAMNTARPPETIRLAAFNIWELSAGKINQVDERGQGTDPQLRNAAEIVQRVRPDVLLINEIDFDEKGENAARFQQRYLAVGQNGQDPIVYPHVFVAPVNTGLPCRRRSKGADPFRPRKPARTVYLPGNRSLEPGTLIFTPPRSPDPKSHGLSVPLIFNPRQSC